MLADALVDFRCISLDPTKHWRVIHIKPALFQHLFKVSIRKLVVTVPADAQENDGWLEVPPLER
jgi:hypothetical protein